jgi:eukaryotic-like serine/threonine-protein kinase
MAADRDDDAAVDAVADTAIDAAIRPRVVEARPELDAIAREVMRANAAAALFGKPASVKIGRYQLVREVGTGGGGTVFLATDPELGRPVAVKLIVAGDPAVRARAVAEGQALAKLSHPNVVQVFDVGVVDDRVYLVMELVKGESLRAYAAHASRRDVIRAYRQAGEGLVAAHDAGLVHRDFKPDNAMRGADGRVRVVDFGLAGAEGDQVAGGTPRYMAPEQTRGAAVTAAADQYAFAASLGEAVSGAVTSASDAVTHGARGPSAGGAVTVVARPRRAPLPTPPTAPPTESRAPPVRIPRPPLPRWLDAIVTRGTDPDPAARYPTMSALLRALANDPAARWRRRALIAVPLALGAIGFGVGQLGDPEPLPCNQGGAAIAPAWTAERAAAADAHVVGLGTSFAASAAPRIRAAVADYATAWSKGFDAACLAARREPSATVVARRSACLGSARTQLGAAIDLVTSIDGEALPAAIEALAELPDLDRCADADALIDDVVPPTAAQVAEVAAITEDLDRARVDIGAALPSAPSKTEAAVGRARALGYRPLLAAALLAHGRALEAADRSRDAVSPLIEAGAIAIEVRDDVTAVEAHARLAMARTAAAERPDLTLAAVATIAPLAARLRDREPFVVALLHNHIGVIENAVGHPDRARDELRTALALAREVDGPGAVELAWVRTNLGLLVDDPDERRALEAEAVAVARDRLGDDHPLTLTMRIAAAFGIEDIDRARAEMRTPCIAMARQHPTRRSAILDCGYELSVLDLAAGAEPDARAMLTLIAGAAADLPVSAKAEDVRPEVAAAYASLFDGQVEIAGERFAALAARVRPTADTPWYELIYAADVELGRAAVAERRGDTAAVLAALEGAVRELDRAASVNPLLLIKRRAAWARAWSERVRGRPSAHK